MNYLWNNLFSEFADMERRFDEMFEQLSKGEGKTYGYTLYQGPDGIPHVREYGNAVGEFTNRIGPATTEPFTDISKEGDEIVVTVELPGAKKEDIVLECTDKALNIRAETASKKYTKDLALPEEVVQDSARAEYNNGILEVRLESKGSVQNGRRIEIS